MEGVESLDQGKTWIVLKWKAPSSPNGIIQNYSVEYSVIGFSDGRGRPVFTNKNITTMDNTTEFNVPELHEYTEYRFRVAGRTNGGLGEWSDPIQDDTTIGG